MGHLQRQHDAFHFFTPSILTNVVGFEPRLASYGALTGIVWDAINDPIVGFLSDHLNTRWGRRWWWRRSWREALIPVTGFAPGRVTNLSGLPVTNYNNLGGVILEIPTLKLRLPVVGVPKKDNAWDVNWLLNNAGWLESSAFPGYSGNSVLTSHVTLQYGQDGPFANLHKLMAGDKIFVHSYGSLYVYEVRSVNVSSPSNPSILGHEDDPWLTLFTCAEYYDKAGSYRKRLVVKAALVETLVDSYQSPGR